MIHSAKLYPIHRKLPPRLGKTLIELMNESWDAYLTSPADFAVVDDIITNLAKEGEPGIEIIERTPLSLIISSI